MAKVDECFNKIKEAFTEEKTGKDGVKIKIDVLSENRIRKFLKDNEWILEIDPTTPENVERITGIFKERKDKDAARLIRAIQDKKIIMDRLSRFKDIKPTQMAAAFRSSIANIGKKFKNSGVSLENRILQIKGKWTSQLFKAVDEFNGGSFSKLDEAVEREIYEIFGELKKDPKKSIDSMKKQNGEAFSTSSKGLAENIRNVLEQERVAIAGVEIDRGFIEAYIPQTHSQRRISKAKFDTWKAFIKDRLDTSRTFGPTLVTDAQIDNGLSEIYEGIISGTYNPKLTRNIDIDEVASRKRAIIFKDMQSAFEYNQKFGNGNILQNTASKLDLSARRIGLVERFGTDPVAGFKIVEDYIKMKIGKEMSNADLIEIKKAGREFEYILNGANYAKSMTGSFFDVLSGGFSLSKYGWSGITSGIMDPLAASFKMTNVNGDNIFSSVLKFTNNYISSITMGKAKKLEFANKLGVFIDDMIAGSSTRMMGDGASVPGMMSYVQEKFFKINGLDYITSSEKIAISRMATEDFVRISKLNKLNDATVKNLQAYGLTPEDMKIFREAITEIDGRQYVTPQSLADLDEAKFGDKKNKSRIVDGYSSMILDIMNDGIPTPGVRERSMFAHADPDSAAGIILGLANKMKSFPISQHRLFRSMVDADALDKMKTGWSNRDYKMLAEGTMPYAVVATKMALSFGALYYFKDSAVSLLRGKNPKDPFKLETALEMLGAGGGAGIITDAIFQDYTDRDTISELIAGPVAAGPLQDILDLWSDYIRGDGDSKKTFKLLLRNTPGNNLAYGQAAMAYLLQAEIMDTINPGYSERKRKYLRQQFGEVDILNK
jgi:hypothetical protein